MKITKQDAVDKILDRLFEQYDISDEDMDDFVRWTVDDVVEGSRLSIESSMEYKAVSGFNKLILDAALERDEYSENVNTIIASFAQSIADAHCYNNVDNFSEYRDIVEQELIDKGYLEDVTPQELSDAIEKYATDVLGMGISTNLGYLCDFYQKAAQASYERMETLDR